MNFNTEDKKNAKIIQQWNCEGKNNYTKIMEMHSSDSEDWNNIRNKMWDATPKRLFSKKRTPTWWDKDCYDARRKVRQLVEYAKHNNELWNKYTRQRRIYKNLIKAKKMK